MDHTVAQKCYPRRFRMSTLFHKLPQSNFVFIVNDKYYYNKPTNLFCSHWFKPKADRSMKCPCPLRWATQKTKETEKDVCTWEIVDIAPPKINPVISQECSTCREYKHLIRDQVEQVILIRQRATTNWGSLIWKICTIFHQQRVAGQRLRQMRKYAWITKAMKKKGPKQK